MTIDIDSESKSESKSENERIKTLSSYQIFNTAPEPIFDGLARLAARATDCPIAAITFMGRKHLYFKSKVGIRETEIPRENSYCELVFQKQGFLSIENTENLEGSTMDRISVGATMVRFYAGMPLITADGHILGCLCVMDHVPRALTEEQVQGLKSISQLVLMQLELRRMRVSFTEKYPTASTVVSALGLELRTPMHGIFGGLEILAETNLTNDQQDNLKLAQRASDRLYRTVSLLLQLSQEIQHNKPTGQL